MSYKVYNSKGTKHIGVLQKIKGSFHTLLNFILSFCVQKMFLYIPCVFEQDVYTVYICSKIAVICESFFFSSKFVCVIPVY